VTGKDQTMEKNGSIFDRPETLGRIQKVFFAALVLVLTAEAFVDMHGEFDVVHFYGFYAVFGFISYVILIFTARFLRKLMMRKEDYYDD
jgi:hypothetical protein